MMLRLHGTQNWGQYKYKYTHSYLYYKITMNWVKVNKILMILPIMNLFFWVCVSIMCLCELCVMVDPSMRKMFGGYLSDAVMTVLTLYDNIWHAMTAWQQSYHWHYPSSVIFCSILSSTHIIFDLTFRPTDMNILSLSLKVLHNSSKYLVWVFSLNSLILIDWDWCRACFVIIILFALQLTTENS